MPASAEAIILTRRNRSGAYRSNPRPRRRSFGLCIALIASALAFAFAGTAPALALSSGGGCTPTIHYGAPTVNFTDSPSSPNIGDAVSFNVSSSTPGTVISKDANCDVTTASEPITSYTWDFGDRDAPFAEGSTATGRTVSHAYKTAGPFTVKLTVSTAHSLNIKSIVITPKARTTTTLSSSSDWSIDGQMVTFTAAIQFFTGGVFVFANYPTGTVVFSVDGTPAARVALDPAALNATYSTSGLAVGHHTVVATYAGDGNNFPSDSSVLGQTVQVTTTTTLSSSANPSAFGQTATFTAGVSGRSPTGTIQFTVDDADAGGPVAIDGAGKATYSTSGLSAGLHWIRANYGGDGNNASSASSALSQTVSKVSSTTTLTSSANPSTSGQPVTLSAAISGSSPTGTVQFQVDGTNVGSPIAVDAAGHAAYSTSGLSVGSHNIIATYVGDAGNTSSTSPVLSQTVNPQPAPAGGGGQGGGGSTPSAGAPANGGTPSSGAPSNGGVPNAGVPNGGGATVGAIRPSGTPLVGGSPTARDSRNRGCTRSAAAHKKGKKHHGTKSCGKKKGKKAKGHKGKQGRH